MLRKKQTPPESARRDVRRSPPANVFSYYASRSSSETTVRSRPELAPKPEQRPSLRRHVLQLTYVPTYIAGLALFICLVYVSTLSTTANVQVTGAALDKKTLVVNTEQYEREVGNVLAGSLMNRSKLLIDTDRLADELESTYPELGDVSVVLPLVGRRPIIEVRPARQAIILGADDGPFIVDTKGRVLASTREIDSYLWDSLPRVQDQSGLPAERGKIVLTAETVAFIQEVAYQLHKKNIPLQSLILPATSANELRARIEGKPYYVKLDVRGQGRQQIGTFIAVKKKLERDRVIPAQYIDVRVPEKAFYK